MNVLVSKTEKFINNERFLAYIILQNQHFGMKSSKDIGHTGRDKYMDSIGIPINPHKHNAKLSIKNKFWNGLLTIFVAPNDIIGIILSVFSAILFVLEWGFYLIGNYLFKFDIEEPKAKKYKKKNKPKK